MGNAAVVSKNALKHGVTAALESRSVHDWYCVIVNDPAADLPLLENINDMQRRALNMAQAEVRLRRVLETIAEFKHERDPLFEQYANQKYDFHLYLLLSRNRGLDKWTRDAAKILLKVIIKELRRLERRIDQRARLLERYKREALSKQRKAQKAWCDQFKKD